MASVRKRQWTHKGETSFAWVVTWSDPKRRGADGKPKRLTKTFERKHQADSHRIKVESEIEKGIYVAAVSKDTLAIVLDAYIVHCARRVEARDGLRPETLVTLRGVVRRLHAAIGHFKLRDLDSARIQQWSDDWALSSKGRISRRTVEYSLSVLKRALDVAVTERRIAFNPMRLVAVEPKGRKSTKTTIPTKKQIQNILDQLEIDHHRPKMFKARYLRVAVYLAVFAGLRGSEIRGLQWENVDFAAGVIKVRVSADNWGNLNDPKTEAGLRDVQMGPTLRTVLLAWRDECRAVRRSGLVTDLVAPSPSGGVLCRASLRNTWYRLLKRVFGTVAFRFHDLRHVAASLWIETGLKPKRVQYLMGHASIQVTFDIYGHLFESESEVREALTSISQSFRATTVPRVAPEQIALLLERTGWSQADLAAKVGSKQWIVSNWTRGKIVPTPEQTAIILGLIDGLEMPAVTDVIATTAQQHSLTPAVLH